MNTEVLIDTIRTVIWAGVMLFAVFGLTMYSMVVLFVRGKVLYERKATDATTYNDDRPRIVHGGRP